MKFGARVDSSENHHRVTLVTDDKTHSLAIAPKASGFGSSINGAELLFLALATCYCNDVYREAAKRNVRVEHVEVDVEGALQSEGDPLGNVTYRATVAAHASKGEIEDLIRHTDRLAEIHNTLRAGIPVTLNGAETISLRSDADAR